MKEKFRTVITTDGEVDDMNSFIRFLLYSNEMDLAGVILTSSTFHYAGDSSKGIPPYRWTGTEWLFDLINRYEKIYPNLRIHASGYPTPSYLRSITKIGNISYVGEMEEETEGSRFLEKLFLDDDSRKLYVQTWGGTNTTARALKSIEEKYKNTKYWKDIFNKINKKVIIYIILDQDDSYSSYIQKHWPNLMIINDRFTFWHFAYAWRMHTPMVNTYLNGEWLKENIKFNHGPLLEKYALIGDGQLLDGELYEEQRGTDDYLKSHSEYNRYDFISEGDSPSFFYLINNGLRSLENPSFGGWGGRFTKINNQLFLNEAFDYNPYTQQYEVEYNLERWFDDIQLDFANRADWCISDSYEKANHAPILRINEGIDIDVKPGQKLTLHAMTIDPDGDDLTYYWWRYFEADTFGCIIDSDIQTMESGGLVFSKTRAGKNDHSIFINNNSSDTVTIPIPEDAKKKDTIHIICEVSDGKVKTYQRIILTVIE